MSTPPYSWEAAYLTGQQEYRKGTTMVDLPLPSDPLLAQAVIRGWHDLHDADHDRRIWKRARH
jgi:hypothetical protein